MNFQGRLLCLVASVLAAGCHSSNDNDDAPGSLRPLLAGFNAVADMPAVTFLREEEVWSTIEFGAGTAFKSVDADQYDVNFDVLLPGDKTTACLGDVDKDDVKDESECTRLKSESINVVTQHEYVVGLLGSYGSARVQVYDKTVHEFDTSTTDGDGADQNLEYQFFHWSDALGAVDVYLEPPGTNLSAVQVRGSFSVGGESHGLINEGTYVLTVSPVGNPAAPIYTSENVTLSKQTRVAFAILDGVGSTSPAEDCAFSRSRRRFAGPARQDRATAHARGAGYRERRRLRGRRLLGGPRRQPRPRADVAVSRDRRCRRVGSPARHYSGRQSRRAARARADEPRQRRPLHVLHGQQRERTPRRLERPRPVQAARAVRTTAHRQQRHPKPRLLRRAARQQHLHLVALATLSPGAAGTVHLLDPGGYDLVMARTGATTFSFGPVNVDLAARGLYTIVAVSTVDATRTDAILLDDFVP